MANEKQNKNLDTEERAADKAATLRYVGPIPAPRVGNLPDVRGTRPADQLTQEQIAYVIQTSAVPAVASWWTSD